MRLVLAALAGAVIAALSMPAPCFAFNDGHESMMEANREVKEELITKDAQIIAGIQASCGGEPSCMAAAWASVEVSRCQKGVFVKGGCLGPNGEIMKWTGAYWLIDGIRGGSDCSVVSTLIDGDPFRCN